MRLHRNDKVTFLGRPMVVIQHDSDRYAVELAEPGWDGYASGIWVAEGQVIPAEQLTDSETTAVMSALTEQQLQNALNYLVGYAPEVTVSALRLSAGDLLPERLRNGGAR
jgi:hypothetical protein